MTTAQPAAARVVHLGPGLSVGGLERVMLELARGARAAGHDDRILLFDTAALDAERDLDPAGVPVTCVPRRRGVDPLCALRLAGVLRRQRPAVLHTHNDTALVYGAWARRLLRPAHRPRLIATFHNRPAHATPRARWATRRAAGRAAAVLAVSAELADWLVAARWVPAATAVPLGVDVQQFAPRAAPAAAGGALRVGMLARLAPGKRHDLLAAAVAELQRAGVDLRLTVAGDGPMRSAVHADLARLSGVRLLPAVDDVPALFAELDVAVLLSDHEGAPRVVLEALACGVPVVASAVGGIPELATPADGLFSVPNEVDAIVVALRRLTDPALRRQLSARARRHAVSQRASSRTAACYERHYAG